VNQTTALAASAPAPGGAPGDGGGVLSSLFWRVFALNAVVFAIGTATLILTPVTMRFSLAATEMLILAGGFTVMLVANALLLRLALAPLDRLRQMMARVDLLRPGQRLSAAHAREFASVVDTFNDMLARLERERMESAARALQAGEEERRRLAQELHDEVGQFLTAVLLQLKRVRAQASPAMYEDLEEIQETVRGSLDEIRKVIHRLRPGVLQELGLPRALEALAVSLTDRTGIPVVRTLPAWLTGLGDTVDLAVYRVAQESLTNIARHADASRVELNLTHVDNRVALRIRDDGKGISAATIEGGGIRGMRERALQVGADFEIHPAARGGTVVSFAVDARTPAEVQA
jgi:two-component system sensor histidine kinase UhpB